MQDIQTY